jgi:uncharacterized protein (TIGR02246 family)
VIIMKSVRPMLAACFIAVAIAPALAQAKGVPAEQAIRQTLARYEIALNKADTASIVNLYTRDGVQMSPDAPAAVGLDGLRAAYDGTFKAVSLQLKFNVDEVKVLSKTSALLRSHSVGTLKVNGLDQPARPAAFKELFVLRKQADGEWKFTHYSFSTAPVAR